MKTNHKVEVQIEESITFEGDGILQKAALTVLNSHELDDRCEMMIVVSDDDALCDLNRRFRGIDDPTDVLSFANDNRGPYVGLASDFPRDLGDIVISIDRARIQAVAAEGDLLDEMQLLVVHGTLHLLGYDHETEEDKSRMWGAQEQILRVLGVDIQLPE